MAQERRFNSPALRVHLPLAVTVHLHQSRELEAAFDSYERM